MEKLKVAIGKATDVPVLIKKLSSDNAGQRLGAFQSLASMLFSDRQFYSEALKAIPLLVKLLEEERVPDRQRIFMLLANISTSNHQLFYTKGVDGMESAEKAFLETAEAVATRQEVLKHEQTYLDLLQSPKAQIRSGAAFLLAFLPEIGQKAVEALKDRFEQEKDDFARAGMILALGLLERGKRSKAALDFKKLLENVKSAEPLLKGAIALSAIQVNPELLSEKIIDQLKEAFALPLKHPGAGFYFIQQVDPELFLWNWGRFDEMIVYTLGSFGENGKKIAGKMVIELLNDFIEKQGEAKLLAQAPIDPRLGAWPSMLLRLYFVPNRNEDWFDPEDLSKEQRKILEELSQHELFGEFSVCGIPLRLRDRRKWLGLDPQGPFEKKSKYEYHGKTYDWPLWKLWKLMEKEKILMPERDQLLQKYFSDLERLKIYAEVSTQAYEVQYPVQEDLFQDALQKSYQEAVDWAENFAEELLKIPLFRIILIPAKVAALYPLVRALKSGKTLDERYDSLVAVSRPFQENREILSAIPAKRRSVIMNKQFDDLAGVRNVPNIALRLFVPFFDLGDNTLQEKIKSLALSDKVNGLIPEPELEQLRKQVS